MATFHLFFQSGRAKDLSAPLQILTDFHASGGKKAFGNAYITLPLIMFLCTQNDLGETSEIQGRGVVGET